MPTIEAVMALASPQAANIERAGFAVPCLVTKAIEDGAAAGANGLAADIKSIDLVVKSAAPVAAPN